jgi:hypothetical protein
MNGAFDGTGLEGTRSLAVLLSRHGHLDEDGA